MKQDYEALDRCPRCGEYECIEVGFETEFPSQWNGNTFTEVWIKRCPNCSMTYQYALDYTLSDCRVDEVEDYEA